MFRFAPFYVGAHDEGNDWFDLRALVNLAPTTHEPLVYRLAEARSITPTVRWNRCASH